MSSRIGNNVQTFQPVECTFQPVEYKMKLSAQRNAGNRKGKISKRITDCFALFKESTKERLFYLNVIKCHVLLLSYEQKN